MEPVFGQLTTAPSLVARVQKSLIAAVLLVSAAALSTMLPFTEKGKLSGKLIGVTVAAVATLPLPLPWLLLRLAAPLRLSFVRSDDEQRFSDSMDGAPPLGRHQVPDAACLPARPTHPVHLSTT